MNRRIIYNLVKLNSIIYLIIFFIALFLIQLPFILIGGEIQNSSAESIKNDSGLTVLFIMLVLIAPIFETLVFQFFIIEGCRYFLRKFISLRLIFIISTIISALAFASSHTYSACYFIGSICSGIIFAVLYSLSKYRKEPAFIFPLILHVFWNLFVFVVTDI